MTSCLRERKWNNLNASRKYQTMCVFRCAHRPLPIPSWSLLGNVYNVSYTNRTAVKSYTSSKKFKSLVTDGLPQQNIRMYTQEEYSNQSQSEERAAWAATVRTAVGELRPQFWTPKLDPPPLLASVAVVIVSPRRPVSAGTVARALSCFECTDLRIVAPRNNWCSKHSKSASQGAQYLLYNARTFNTVQEAVADADLSVAFARWTSGKKNVFRSLPELLAHPTVKKMLKHPPQPENGCSPAVDSKVALEGVSQVGLDCEPSSSSHSRHQKGDVSDLQLGTSYEGVGDTEGSNRRGPEDKSDASQSVVGVNFNDSNDHGSSGGCSSSSSHVSISESSGHSSEHATKSDDNFHTSGVESTSHSVQHTYLPSGLEERLSSSSSSSDREAMVQGNQSLSSSNSSSSVSYADTRKSSTSTSHVGTRVVLVFGREELGLSDDEVAACDAVCSIPIGRLQESLSLSHAVSIALSTIYQERLSYVGENYQALSQNELTSECNATSELED